MSVGQDFQDFLNNIKVAKADTFALRYGEITSALNKEYRDTDSKTSNSLQIGSYGRWTAIKGISDLDMIYIMPSSKWDYYKEKGPSRLLADTKAAISKRYPHTTVKVDRLIVRAMYNDFHVEVQPAFEEPDGSFKYPDSYGDGTWKITKPRLEISEMKATNESKNSNLRRLCKMARAWKNKHGVGMGGLLIDTLAYNFLMSTDDYDDRGMAYSGWLCRDFFEYLKNEPDKERYAAVGSKQHVRVQKKFQKKAGEAYELCLKAIAAEGQKNERQKWRSVFGNGYPSPATLEKAAYAHVYEDTEQFIEDKFPVDIRYDLTINCEVSQNGFRDGLLLEMLRTFVPLRASKKLRFFIESDTAPAYCEIHWKILNRGDAAMRKDCIRGQIVHDQGRREKREETSFNGEHWVECYAVLNGVVVARGGILVPIN